MRVMMMKTSTHYWQRRPAHFLNVFYYLFLGGGRLQSRTPRGQGMRFQTVSQKATLNNYSTLPVQGSWA